MSPPRRVIAEDCRSKRPIRQRWARCEAGKVDGIQDHLYPPVRQSWLFIEAAFAAMIHCHIPEDSGKDEGIVMPRNCVVTNENRWRIWKMQQAGKNLGMVMPVNNVRRAGNFPKIAVNRNVVSADFVRHRP
jgi:hypothetical protein